MSSTVVDLASRLEASPPSAALDAVLSTLWNRPRTDDPASSSSSSRKTRGSVPDIDTGAHPTDGAALHSSLLNLVERKASGMEAVTLLGLSKAGIVDVIHSLFTVRANDYDMAPELWGILGEVPENGLPSIVSILPIDLSTIDPFYGTTSEEFESHVTGLSSTLQRHLDTNAHPESSKSDEGATIISVRGLAFIPASAASLFLELPAPVTIAEASARLVPHLIRSSYLHALDPLRWLQASFTARAGGDYISGPIRTRRALGIPSPLAGSPHHSQLLAHLKTSFPGRFNPPPISPPRLRGGGTSTSSQTTAIATTTTLGPTLPTVTPTTGNPPSGSATSVTWGVAPPTGQAALVGASVLAGLGGSPPGTVGASVGAGVGASPGTGTPGPVGGTRSGAGLGGIGGGGGGSGGGGGGGGGGCAQAPGRI